MQPLNFNQIKTDYVEFKKEGDDILDDSDCGIKKQNVKDENVMKVISKRILGNYDEKRLKSTLSEKFIKPKAEKRVQRKTIKEPEDTSDKTISIIKEKLLLAEKKYGQAEFKKAAALYESVIKSDGVSCNLHKDLHLCYMELWKKENNPKEKQEWLSKAISTLEKYVESQASLDKKYKAAYLYHIERWKKESRFEEQKKYISEAISNLKNYLACQTNFDDKKILFNSFAFDMNEYALSLIDDNHFLSYKYFKFLLECDLNCKELISPDLFTEIIDGILHNMTVCIEYQEKKNKGSMNVVRNEMKTLITNPLIDQELQDNYQTWLNRDWNRDWNSSQNEDDLRESAEIASDCEDKKSPLLFFEDDGTHSQWFEEKYNSDESIDVFNK